jgi:basic amino acid/polyamine antiporter, APA family
VRVKVKNKNLDYSTATGKPTLAFIDAVALIVGIVIGAGIFETPAFVAANTGSDELLLLTWVLGGGMSLIGAVCYAELATAYPHPGGNYYYLQRAFGKAIAFLFAWGRMTVIQTGSLALLAFVFGDYASQILPLGDYSSSVYAALAIGILTVLNLIGIRQGKWTQNWLTAAKVLGLLLVVIVGLLFASPSTPVEPIKSEFSLNLGRAMIFVLLSYGGWNEAVYISSELDNLKRNMVRSLIWSISIITAIYLAINLAYLQGLGLETMAASEAVATQLMNRAVGAAGAWSITLLIVVSTLGAINATIFTGARTNYALGKDFAVFSFLGRWHRSTQSPPPALLVQAAIALFLVFLGTLTRRGFETMVDYTAPAFWFFFLLTSLSLLVLRFKEPEVPRPFKVPFYPVTPILFCLICAYLLYSSLVYTGIGALVGVAILIAGVPLLLWSRRNR